MSMARGEPASRASTFRDKRPDESFEQYFKAAVEHGAGVRDHATDRDVKTDRGLAVISLKHRLKLKALLKDSASSAGGANRPAFGGEATLGLSETQPESDRTPGRGGRAKLRSPLDVSQQVASGSASSASGAQQPAFGGEATLGSEPDPGSDHGFWRCPHCTEWINAMVVEDDCCPQCDGAHVRPPKRACTPGRSGRAKLRSRLDVSQPVASGSASSASGAQQPAFGGGGGSKAKAPPPVLEPWRENPRGGMYRRPEDRGASPRVPQDAQEEPELLGEVRYGRRYCEPASAKCGRRGQNRGMYAWECGKDLRRDRVNEGEPVPKQLPHPSAGIYRRPAPPPQSMFWTPRGVGFSEPPQELEPVVEPAFDSLLTPCTYEPPPGFQNADTRLRPFRSGASASPSPAPRTHEEDDDEADELQQLQAGGAWESLVAPATKNVFDESVVVSYAEFMNDTKWRLKELGPFL